MIEIEMASKWILGGILLFFIAIITIYVFFRIAILATAKSWKQVMNCDKCKNGGDHNEENQKDGKEIVIQEQKEQKCPK